MIDLRFGDWRDVLADFGQPIEVDCIITDPPYGKKTHEATRALGNERRDGSSLDALGPSYSAWTRDDVFEFVRTWSPVTRGWMNCLTSHDLIPAWQDAYEDVGRYSFAPVVCVMTGMSVRLAGDGPSSWAVYSMVGRPRWEDPWGTLPGAYVGKRGHEGGEGRGKPDWLCRALVRDYSRKGDLVCDPFAGWGHQLMAADGMGRRAIGSEVARDAFDEANRRIARGVQIDLLAEVS